VAKYQYKIAIRIKGKRIMQSKNINIAQGVSMVTWAYR
jgi:hypothetical protein